MWLGTRGKVMVVGCCVAWNGANVVDGRGWVMGVGRRCVLVLARMGAVLVVLVWLSSVDIVIESARDARLTTRVVLGSKHPSVIGGQHASERLGRHIGWKAL